MRLLLFALLSCTALCGSESGRLDFLWRGGALAGAPENSLHLDRREVSGRWTPDFFSAAILLREESHSDLYALRTLRALVGLPLGAFQVLSGVSVEKETAPELSLVRSRTRPTLAVFRHGSGWNAEMHWLSPEDAYLQADFSPQLLPLLRLEAGMEITGEARQMFLRVYWRIRGGAGFFTGLSLPASAPETGLWLELSRTTLRFSLQWPGTAGEELLAEIRLSHHFRSATSEPLPGRSMPGWIPTRPPQKKKASLPEARTLPSIAVLIGWGLSPSEALQWRTHRDICALDEKSRTILARKHWLCRGGSR